MDLELLIDAIRTLNADDAFRPRFSPDQWRLFGNYLLRRELRGNQLVVREGEFERSMFLLESGTVQVFVEQTMPGRQRVALLRAGAIFGEPAMFAEVPRMASVETMGPCVAWEFSGLRLDELGLSRPAVALEFMRAAGAVLAARMRANLQRGTPLT